MDGGTISKVIKYVIGILGEKRENEETDKIFEVTIAKNFPELIMIDIKTTDPASSENTIQDKQEKHNKNLVIPYLNCRKHKKRKS